VAGLEQLTGRVMVLVAHPDDECVGYGALLQRMRDPIMVIATSGAPRDPYFWQQYGSQQAYQAVRREEVRRAMQAVGVQRLVMLADEDERLEDQRLFLNLAPAYELLTKLVERERPEAIATLAYEGGHPDHDSCGVLGARLGKQFGLPVWEAPLYHREPVEGATGEPPMQLQRFLTLTGGEVELEITAEELERKRLMCAQYSSQGEILNRFDARRETLRPQIAYDYARPPHQGPVNYEVWQWWMSERAVSAKFAEFMGMSKSCD